MDGKSFNMGFLAVIVIGMVFTLFPRETEAIPPFARKYKTACTTCHWGTFPKLNAFGRAFYANGLRMPGGDDEVFVKEEPVSMGASAWSRLFPKAVWPGTIPHLPAIGFRMVSEFAMTKERPRDPRGGDAGRPDRGSDSNFVGIESLEVLFGGTFGDTLSFFGAGSIDELERAYLNYAPFLFGEQGFFNFRFGRLDMRVTPMTSHRRQLSLAPFIMDVMPTVSSGNFWGFHPAQNGVEIWGSLNGPGGKGGLEWAAGIVNGETGEGIELFDGTGDMGTIIENVEDEAGGPFGGEFNNNKDWYVMVSYKLGGMGVLGGGAQNGSLVSKGNWQDNSVRIKGYYYRGVTGAYVDDPITGSAGNPLVGGVFDKNANRFKRYGIVIDANWWNFNLIGVASFMEDDIKGSVTYEAGSFGSNSPRESGSSFDTSIYTGEIECVVLPWIVPAFRIENVNPSYDARDIKSFTKYTFDTTIIPRANFKVLAGVTWTDYPDKKTGIDGLDVDGIDFGSFLDTTYRIGVDIAF
ncbi:MAG: hypothetical protein D8M57_05665 [Candidatus Scalindua sp. AMX11]|nr:MAG: hypothetical protein DWQ00_02030 [Candidatus Scalindua sp.]NOG82826.1 hypothetical protein [Planctomycetota bacterium]RZV86175.1 MAG: hypothetical protein EX341_07340 [Candidatus Scalindua sp. SCAELEC01]TDE65794.1 MAG: hypothetical protein D8M57_05665 [Candidatus Scalindua sp. AMX11]GJQ58297.1 MAG: hypothetical protein SCALA701_10980 [Candidatus Scalindua sp.]